MKTITIATALAALFCPPMWGQVINVEIDYMRNMDHSHRPQQAEIDAVVAMFACQGYTLNVVISDAIPHTNIIRCDDVVNDSFFNCSSSTFTTFEEIKDTYSDIPFPGTGWHYCVFGHQYNSQGVTNSSGLAEVGGNDLLVTLGAFINPGGEPIGTPFQRASTFAHELGHNLGLRHFGQNSTFSLGPFAPNYASIMSYQYQLSGLKTQMKCLGLVSNDHLFKDMDYSSGRLPTLMTAALDESTGVGIHKADWNCNGLLDSSAVVQSIDVSQPWCSAPVGVSVLSDYDDWANIVDSAFTLAVASESVEHEIITCMTQSEYQHEVESLGFSEPGLNVPSTCNGSNPTLFLESCPRGKMIWAVSSTGFGFGTGDNPATSIADALVLSPPDSVIYLQPGVYDNRGVPLVIDQAVVLAGPGGAIIDP